jgi:protocatechuate 3,4-dioxygenase beta subunit
MSEAGRTFDDEDRNVTLTYSSDLTDMMSSGPIDRRSVLRTLGGLAAAGLAAACGRSPRQASPQASVTVAPRGAQGAAGSGGPTSLAPPGTASTVSCVLDPEVTEGPYYLDLNLVRSDITEGRPGVPLTLAVTVAEAARCTPIKDAAVDIWHCDAGGTYSGVAGNGGSFLRGSQMTDENGAVAFHTIYPGWYMGRAVHIHIKVHAGGNVVHTGQFFFSDDLTDKVYEQSPYSSRGARDLRNAQDDIFRQAGAHSVLSVLPSGTGYATAINVGVKQV